jgi:hypothetical protein
MHNQVMRRFLSYAALAFAATAFSACDLDALRGASYREGLSSFDPSDPANKPERARFAKPGPAADEKPQDKGGASGQLAMAAGTTGAGGTEADVAKNSKIFDGSGELPSGAPKFKATGGMDKMPPADQIGSLAFDDGTKKKLSREDLLWLARAIHGETAGSATEEQAAAMTWTLAQRMRWSPTFRSWSMAKLTQAFSQPVNPNWLADGKFCKGQAKEACSARRTKLREKYRSLEWDEISPAARKVVVAFSQGQLDNRYVGLVDWLDRDMWEKGRYDQRHVAGSASRCDTDKAEFSRLKIRGDAYSAVRCPGHALDTWSWKGSEVVAVGPDGKKSLAYTLDGKDAQKPVMVATAN